MSLQTFSKQKTGIKPITVGSSLIENFRKGSIQKIQQQNISLRKIEPKKQTKWQWISKQLMKPVGLVAAEAENIGIFLGGNKAQMFGKAGLDVLSGKKETSFSQIWRENAAGFGLSASTAGKIGFVFDITNDPLNFIGGGLTKLGKLSTKINSLAKSGKTVVKGSKLANQIAKSGYTTKELVLAGSKAEQAAKGQRALIKIAGKPIIGGERVYKAATKLSAMMKATKIGVGLRRTFSTKTGIKEVDELVRNYKNLSGFRKEQVLDNAITIQKKVNNLKSGEVKMLVEAIENPVAKEMLKGKPIIPAVSKLFHHTDVKIGDVLKAGKPSVKNYFGEGIYLGSEKGVYPGKFIKEVQIPKGLKTLDLTKKGADDLFLNQVSRITKIPVENTGMGVFEDLRMMASKISDDIVRRAVDKITKGYEAVKSPLAYEGQFEMVIKKPFLKAVKEVKPAVAEIPNKIVSLADEMEDLFKQMKTTEKAKGILKTELEQYFPHIKAEMKLGERIKAFFQPKKYSTFLGAAKGRKIEGTINEINARFGKEFFQTNPVLAYAQRGLASAKAITAKEFLDDIGRKFFKNAEDAPIRFQESTNPLFKGLKAEPEIVKVVDEYIQGIKPDDLNLIVRGFDRIQNWWKAQVLISPSYHTRNMVSNFWNNWIAGVKNPVLYEKARKIQSGKALNKVIMKTDTGEVLTRGQIIKETKQQGVMGRGFYGSDIRQALDDKIGAISQRAKKISGWMPWKQDNVLFKTNREVGSAIENNARVAHYLHQRQIGLSPVDAAMSVKKYLFDYDDLSKVEKNIFKRIFPFYTWTRKNLPLQLEQLLVQPEKYAAIPKIIKEIEAGVASPETEKYMSEYISENIPVRIRTNPKGHAEYFLLGWWLPFASAIDLISQPIDNMINMTTPLLKTPFELWANKSMFFKNTLGEASKIEYYYKQPTEFIGLPMRKKTATLMRTIRVFNDLHKLIKTPAKDEPENTWVVKFLSVLLGKAATYDIKKAQYFYRRDTEERISEYKAAIKKAKKLGKPEHAKKLLEELRAFQKER